METTMAIWLISTTAATLFFVFKLAQMDNKKTERKHELEMEKLRVDELRTKTGI